MADQAQWQLFGDYFENCSCSVGVLVSFRRLLPLPQNQQRVSATCRLSFTLKMADTTASRLMGLTWRSQSKRLTDGRRKLVGRCLYRRAR